jgi:hypothetical protein
MPSSPLGLGLGLGGGACGASSYAYATFAGVLALLISFSAGLLTSSPAVTQAAGISSSTSTSSFMSRLGGTASAPLARLRLQMQTMLSDSAVPDLHSQSWRGFEGAPVPPGERDFLINGWRWHSKAAARELRRLRQTASSSSSSSFSPPRPGEGLDRLQEGYDFVWSFMYRKLHMVEGDVFFPWLRCNLPADALPVLDELEREREAVRRVGLRLGQVVRQASRPVTAPPQAQAQAAALKSAVELMDQLGKMACALQKRQEAFLIPQVAAHVSPKVQQKFNQKVIASLGIVDAQALLVSMHDAIRGDPKEYRRFKKEVPRAAQTVLPALRATFYAPKQRALLPDPDRLPLDVESLQ